MKAQIFLEGVNLPYMGVDRKTMKLWTKKIGRVLSCENVIVAVILTDNHFIQNINRTYRGKDRPTDVIAFDYHEEPFPGNETVVDHLGDIYISIERTREQAETYGVPFSLEFKRLLVHGILHLTGYDHEKSRKEAKKMHSREEEILSML